MSYVGIGAAIDSTVLFLKVLFVVLILSICTSVFLGIKLYKVTHSKAKVEVVK